MDEFHNGGEANRHSSRDHEAERHRWVEVAAGDVTDGRRHHADDEAVREGDGRQVAAERRDDRAGADENQREGAHELRECPLQDVETHAQTVETKPDDTGESVRGMAETQLFADKTLGVSTAERKAAMAAEILKRKLRNFPVANLTERIAA